MIRCRHGRISGRLLLALLAGMWAAGATAQPPTEQEEAEAGRIREGYAKFEYRIPMRDGVRLFTSVYIPNERSKSYPILLRRTPYGVNPYGASEYREDLGPSRALAEKGYIFVYQDVREKYMSEGTFVNMRPHIAAKGPGDIDESTDTWDTVDWLVKNLPANNGKVGIWGISYPGFYTAAGIIDTHPALVAASPQAPIADWFFDDFHHHGAFFLPHTFNFFASFGKPREGPTTERNERFDHGTPDGYRFFLDLGPLANANDEDYLGGEIPFWNEIIAHPDYDGFWQARNLLPHLRNIRSAVMTVGGWFDAEDLYGPLKIYRSIEEKNPGTFNMLVMGPWSHGAWGRNDGDKLGDISFGFATSRFYQEKIELAFFEHFLKGEGELHLPEAYVFETGANRWRTFDTWPPEGLEERHLYLREGGRLSFEAPAAEGESYDEYVSDPAKPVPFTQVIDPGMTREYMTADQRFAARRPDVLAWESEVLEDDLTLAGPLLAELWVSTSGTDADWVVKVIDVFPGDAPDPDPNPTGVRMGGYQMMVRSEVFRGRYRDSYERPEPFVPGEPTPVVFELQDVLHTFQRGHRVMVQIQSTWFPLVDRNPQRFVPNIFEAKEEDFVRATHRVYRSAEHPTRIKVGVLPGLGAHP